MSELYPQTCPVCSAEFYAKSASNRKFCSRPCYRKSRQTGQITGEGYIRTCRDGQRILEHRLIMQQHLGRLLLETEVVHHIDGNRKNNSIDNLQVFNSASEHSEHHRSEKRFVSDTHAECLMCSQVKIRSEFSPAPHTKINVKPYCKQCWVIRNANYNTRKATA